MKTARHNFPTFLLRNHCISRAQLAEAIRLQRQAGTSLRETLVKLGYATEAEVARALAESYGLTYIDLTEVNIPLPVVELIPESVARENVVLPLAQDGSALTVAIADPSDRGLVQKLQFILNRDIGVMVAARGQLIEAINRHYGATETESVDSCLQQFTDTQIELCEAVALDDSVGELQQSEFNLALDANAAEPSATVVTGCSLEAFETPSLEETPPPALQRQATVRYYHRMNPEKMFPLLVVVSEHKILEVVQRGVSQGVSKRFRVEPGTVVEVEPILPGCTCYPPRESLRIVPGESLARFWVVPHVLGKVMQARVVIRKSGEVLAEVPVEMRVVKQTATLLMAAMTCLLPLVAAVLQHVGIDLKARLEEGLYGRLTNLLLGSLSPDMLALLLLGMTCGLYLWLRPRKRDVFWDVIPDRPEERLERARAADEAGNKAAGTRHLAEVIAESPDSQPAWLQAADRLYREKNCRDALALYRKALALGPWPAAAYAGAALAAGQLGKNAQALAILKEALAQLPPSEVTGAMWYNMGCFAARLGLGKDAVGYLGRAVDLGYAKVAKFRNDPDLHGLRRRPDFQALLACVDS